MQDCIICGGAQETNLYSVASFDGIQSFSIREDNPAKASRPFDRDRDGLVPGGGAATVIIESYEHAVKRGAPILAEIVSWGFSGNGDHISTPNVAGPARSLELCLNKGGISPQQIGYINAHATSTRIGDSREASAIAQIFSDCRVPVTSTKSQTGHEMWMAGASELIYSMLMMKNDFIAGNINFENPDEETARIHILPETREAHFDMFLSNSFGFGGTNSTLVIIIFFLNGYYKFLTIRVEFVPPNPKELERNISKCASRVSGNIWIRAVSSSGFSKLMFPAIKSFFIINIE